jgi:hypothetical protein
MENQNFKPELITDVRVSTNEYIKKYYWKQTKYLLYFCCIWIMIFITIDLTTAIVFPVIAISALYTIVITKVKHEFMRQFAETNMFTYEFTGSLVGRVGVIFNKGRSIKLEDLITGNFKQYRFELFNYKYTEGSGKNSHTHYFTVFQIHFDHHVPHLMLTKKVFGFPQMFASNFSNGKTLNLEGNFNGKFAVTVEKEFEIEALQILTPEIMEGLLSFQGYSFEFFNQDLYIYHNGYITKKDELVRMHELTVFLIEKLGLRLSRMSGGVKAMLEQGDSIRAK